MHVHVNIHSDPKLIKQVAMQTRSLHQQRGLQQQNYQRCKTTNNMVDNTTFMQLHKYIILIRLEILLIIIKTGDQQVQIATVFLLKEGQILAPLQELS